jgi:L-amino acid N-acyltransferase YncA
MTLIRDAADADLAAIVAIYNAAVPARMATADTEPVTTESRVAWLRHHTRDRRPCWVAVADGEVRAWLSFESFYGRPAYHATAELSVYVAPAHRRRGLGRRLLGQAIARAPKLGLRTVLGFIFAHNEPSVALFEAQGFARWANLPQVAELDGIERDLLILGRRVA